MLDDVAFGPFPEQPARKDAIPFVVALILHGQLDEGAGFGRILPRRGRLARAQPHDRAADARDVAGLHLELADQAVALVEQPDHGDALIHRGRPLDAADFLRDAVGLRQLRARLARPFAVPATIARGERGRRDEREKRATDEVRPHSIQSAPGRQAS